MFLSVIIANILSFFNLSLRVSHCHSLDLFSLRFCKACILVEPRCQNSFLMQSLYDRPSVFKADQNHFAGFFFPRFTGAVGSAFKAQITQFGFK
uniref:Secreted protein n=1 Tax=Salix viminalis TaxID=40686 RepID=A0A6N2LDW9_SALVM